jgi:G3E family GTPase
MTKILDETRLIESYALDQVICMVDATKFLKLFDSLPVLSRQIQYSDIIILNKIDLVNHKILGQIKSEINSMNVKAKIFETSFAEMDMDSLNKVDTIEKKESQKSINQPLKRPATLYLKKNPTTVLNLRTFLNEIEGKVLRIKGFIKIDEEMYYVNDNNDRITLEKVPAATQKLGISVICKQGYDEKIKKSWEKYI